MNKTFKGVLCLLCAVIMLFCTVGCSNNTTDGEKQYDTETRPLTFAIGALDGNFNPFFYTSANDGSVIAMTQISMLTTDSDGNLVCGNDYATVALDYTITMYDSTGVNVVENGDSDGYTDYEFVIKNGIKFSDGEELTIADVLFNLYVYLDPLYTGSSTIYSVDIVGLKAYQNQDPELNDDADVDTTSYFNSQAQQRLNNIIEYLTEKDVDITDEIEQGLRDTLVEFRSELESDWTTVEEATLESYEEYSFTEIWEAYMLSEGVISIQYELTTNGYQAKKDANGKYVTSLDDSNNTLAEEMASAMSADKIQAYMTANECTEDVAKAALMKQAAIDLAYTANTGIAWDDAYAEDSDEIDLNRIIKSAVAEILQYWATGSTMLENFIVDVKSEYYADKSGEVDSIKGITTYKKIVDGEEHDVLKIRINGIDPKAIWNFSFVVAPMHYYSDYSDSMSAEEKAKYNYGVKFADKDFFNNVLQSADKNGLPVGAGVYKATDSSNSDDVDRTTFFKNNMVYFTRNEYFETVGTGISNAKIKMFRYKVVSTDNLISALKAEEIDYGEPNAKVANINDVASVSYLGYKTYRTGGYGYVGINPKYVPDIEVRQAIIKAMNVSVIINDYYSSDLAEIIRRPMSATSWAYPTSAKAYYTYTTDATEIEALVESAGWKKNSNGIYEKNGETLKLTFTIAGETEDHPAFNMFQQAAEFLNKCGFDITVTTDVNALKKLSTGNLAVWAAAWSTASDPDMYQNYHKDSSASALKNWYCQGMLNDTTSQFTYEKTLINELAELIEEGRSTNNQATRAQIYAQALDVVMELAIELPTYQRNDLVVWNSKVIDSSTLNQNPSYNEGVVSRIWEVDYN